MVTAAASTVAISDPDDAALTVDIFGAQTLLEPNGPRPNYPVQIVAVAIYALALASVVYLSRPAPEQVVEEPLELVLAPPLEEPPPPEPIPEQADEPPPPPEAAEPIAPIEKPVPKPKIEKKVQKPVERRPPVVRADPAPPAAPTANLSAISSQIHARLQRAAANAYPESQAPRSARVGYRVSFSASGALTSFSIVPSGNAAFDAVASRLGGRIGSISPPGKPVSLSGSLTFSP